MMRLPEKSLLSALLALLLHFNLRAQNDTVWKAKPEIEIGGFLDVFYAYDFNKPKTDYRQTFFYNHNRHNEFNLNLGYIKLSAEHLKYRAKLAFQAGAYVNDNYASEPGVLNNLFEASAGISLNKQNTIWLDGGIFASHIGFESAVSLDNWTLTRSIPAENSPYYLTGAKITFSPGSKWNVMALICNGWQRIPKLQGNSLPSFGTQVQFFPSEKAVVNYSTFIGTDTPDSTRRMRYFHNIYAQAQLAKKIGMIAGFDIGMQQHTKGASKYDVWFSPVMIVRYSFTSKWATAVRAEYYQDESGVIIPADSPNGFNTFGLSLNVDYTPIPILACRVECRWLRSRDKIFAKENEMTNTNVFITVSLVVRFDK